MVVIFLVSGFVVFCLKLSVLVMCCSVFWFRLVLVLLLLMW